MAGGCGSLSEVKPCVRTEKSLPRSCQCGPPRCKGVASTATVANAGFHSSSTALERPKWATLAASVEVGLLSLLPVGWTKETAGVLLRRRVPHCTSLGPRIDRGTRAFFLRRRIFRPFYFE